MNEATLDTAVVSPAQLPLLARAKLSLDKWRVAGEARYKQDSFGRFYVLYNDGAKSESMDYTTASDYAEIFGGTVVHKELNCVC